jgi:hypothetical protein
MKSKKRFVYLITALFNFLMTGACSDMLEGFLTQDAGSHNSFYSHHIEIAADDSSGGDYFGVSVAIDGDYAVIGACGEDGENGDDRGAAYIFQRQAVNNWVEIKKLTADVPLNRDRFGIAVDIDGDYIIVGANGGNAAFIFYRNWGGDNNWGLVKKITAADVEERDCFGGSVSIDGDYVVVGAHLEDGAAGVDRGAAYIFYKEGTPDNWTEVQKLTASDAEDRASFGFSVAMSGDYAVIGAYLKDVAGFSDVGEAYVFYREGTPGNWTETAKFTPHQEKIQIQFGISVSISGDYAIVGAHREDVTPGHSAEMCECGGAAHIYHRNGTPDNWEEVTTLTSSDVQPHDYFGCAVAISGDLAIVGANNDTSPEKWGRGAAYVFNRIQGESNNWEEITKLVDLTAGRFETFGRSVDISSNYAIVGKNVYDSIYTGNVFIYER